MRTIVGCWGGDDLIDKAFAITEYTATDELVLGPLRIRFCEVPHFTVTHAVDLASNGSRFTFSADCRPNDALVAFALGTDVLMIEATLPRPERTGVRGHLTAREAGEHGRLAGARRLILTHYSDELDPGMDARRGDRQLRWAGGAGPGGRGLHRLGAAATTAMSNRDPFANFDRMRREMDELFGDVFERSGLSRRRTGQWPPVDVAYASDPPRAIVTAELAGRPGVRDRAADRGPHLDPRRAPRRGVTGGRGVPAGGDRARRVPPGDRSRRRDPRRPGHRAVPGRDAAGGASAGRNGIPIPEPCRSRAASRHERSPPQRMIEVEVPAGDAQDVAIGGARKLPDRIGVLPLREAVTFPELVVPAERRPGAQPGAGQRRAARRSLARARGRTRARRGDADA